MMPWSGLGAAFDWAWFVGAAVWKAPSFLPQRDQMSAWGCLPRGLAQERAAVAAPTISSTIARNVSISKGLVR